MDTEAEIGLVVIGAGRLAVHLAALKRLGGVQIIGPSTGEVGQEASGPLHLGVYNRLLSRQDVHAAVICTPLREREYWVVQAASAGKHVFCESPVTSSFARTHQLITRCASSSVVLALAADVLYGNLGRFIHQVFEERKIGPAVFVELGISVPQTWLRGTREGVVLRYGVPFLSMLGSRFGGVDSVYARTRSLGLNRPEEDVALVLLRFKDGLEGLLQINGLGDVAQVRLQVYSGDGNTTYTAPLEEACLQGLCFQYEDFLQALREKRAPSFSGAQVLEGMRYLEWIQQSARLEREVYRNEVILG